MSGQNRNGSQEGSFDQLSDEDLQSILTAEEAYQQELLANPILWLPEQDIFTLGGAPLEETRWRGLVRPQEFLSYLRTLSVEEIESDLGYARYSKSRRRHKSGKAGNRKRSGTESQSFSVGKSLPVSEVFDAVVQQYIGDMKPASNTGDLYFATQNALFGNLQKAITYKDGFRRIVEPHHLLFWTEVNKDFLKELGQQNGYGYWTSIENNRDQAVGIMAHPRLIKIGGPYSYDAVATVQGIPNLRPAFRVDFKDNWSGLLIKAVVVHLKSMRGGAQATSAVRLRQCQALARELGSATEGVKPEMTNQCNFNYFRNKIFGGAVLDHGTVSMAVRVCLLSDEERNLPMEERLKRGYTVIGGDWNCILNATDDTTPLIQAGYGIVNPVDATETQKQGSRLDGWHAEDPCGCSGEIE